MQNIWNLTSFDVFSKIILKKDLYVLVHVLERILDNSCQFKKNPNFCSLSPGAGAGSGLKIPGAEAVLKQAGSETMVGADKNHKISAVLRIQNKIIQIRIQDFASLV